MVNAKAKGSAGEREAISVLNGMLERNGFAGIELSRNLNQARDGGSDILGMPGIAIEVKRQKTLDIPGWWNQICAAARPSGALPLLMYRQNHRPWFFRLPLYAAVYGTDGSGAIAPIVATLDADNFEKWLRAYLIKAVE